MLETPSTPPQNKAFNVKPALTPSSPTPAANSTPSASNTDPTSTNNSNSANSASGTPNGPQGNTTNSDTANTAPAPAKAVNPEEMIKKVKEVVDSARSMVASSIEPKKASSSLVAEKKATMSTSMSQSNSTSPGSFVKVNNFLDDKNQA
eukprot:CAMPEP_0116908202 /NCGR_PEP_ID=MMETSP0467-20121206/13555_1 /TAXON_ID=283647 /ORGANISM="Mesodinium pulex, Strain SPMC105" /LENGTH=148 /DNA_ID=CAMNT_0004583355 /DNA_START=411 /DNA_END=856 /DNA_ORIENTATION=-